MTLMEMWGGAAGMGIALLVLFFFCSVCSTKCVLRILTTAGNSLVACFKALGGMLDDFRESVMDGIFYIHERLVDLQVTVTETCCCDLC